MHGIILQDKMKWSYQSMVEQSKLTLRHKGAYHDFLSMILIFKYVHIAFYHYTPLHILYMFFQNNIFFVQIWLQKILISFSIAYVIQYHLQTSQ